MYLNDLDDDDAANVDDDEGDLFIESDRFLFQIVLLLVTISDSTVCNFSVLCNDRCDMIKLLSMRPLHPLRIIIVSISYDKAVLCLLHEYVP
jgi:hypothetical protein